MCFHYLIVLGFLLSVPDALARVKNELQFNQNDMISSYIGTKLSYWVDESGQTTAQQLLTLPSESFQIGQNDVLNFGFINQYVWVKWVPDQDTDYIQHDYVISIDFSAIHEIEFYFFKNGKIQKLYETGTQKLFNTRPLKLTNFAFPVRHQGEVPEAIYLRLRASNALILPIRIYSKEGLLEKSYKQNILWGALFGLLLLMSIINFSLFVLIKRTYYLYYMGYALFVGLTLASLSGHGFMVLWPSRPDVNSFSIAFFTCMMIFFGLMFSMKYLSVRSQLSANTYYFGVGLALAALSVACVSLFVDRDMAFFAAVVATVFAPFAAYLGCRGIQKKIVGAKIFTAAWMIFLTGVSFYALIVLDLIEPSMFRMHLKEYGAVAEMLLLSIGVAIQMKNSIQKQHELQYEISRTLIERNEALKKSARTKEEFFNMMTHELRTPMNGIIGSVDNLREAKDIENANIAFQAIKNSSNEMMKLIENMLLYQEISSGDVEIDNRSIDLLQALERTANYFSQVCDNKGLNFVYQPLGDLPNFIKVDGYKLFTVIYKLLENAVKFTESGRVSLRVAFSYYYPCGCIEINVIDSGYGINSDKLEVLFEPFEQVTAGKTRLNSGLGLGLVLVKGLVNLLQGEIEVDSTLHCGTSVSLKMPIERSTHGRPLDFDWGDEQTPEPNLFKLKLPIPRELEEHSILASDQQNASHQADAEAPLPAHPVHVLIVEDNPTNAVMMKTFVKRLGYTYDHVVNGALAVKLFQEKKIDIIFMDIQMPVMDGIEATVKIRALEAGSDKKVPIIACTANTTMNERKKCLDSGMDAFLAKPIKSNMLKTQIEQLILQVSDQRQQPLNVVDFKTKGQ